MSLPSIARTCTLARYTIVVSAQPRRACLATLRFRAARSLTRRRPDAQTPVRVVGVPARLVSQLRQAGLHLAHERGQVLCRGGHGGDVQRRAVARPADHAPRAPVRGLGARVVLKRPARQQPPAQVALRARRRQGRSARSRALHHAGDKMLVRYEPQAAAWLLAGQGSPLRLCSSSQHPGQGKPLRQCSSSHHPK